MTKSVDFLRVSRASNVPEDTLNSLELIFDGRNDSDLMVPAGEVVTPLAASLASSYPIPSPKYTFISTFQTGHGFTWSGAGSMADRVATDGVIGTQYLRLTTNGAGASTTITKQGNSAVNFTTKRGVLWIRISDSANISAIRIVLYNAVTTNFGIHVINPVSSNNFRSIPLTNQWTPIYFSPADLESTGGTYDPTAVTGWRVQVNDNTTGVPLIADIAGIGHFSIETAQSGKAIFSFGVDDGYKAQRDWLAPALMSYGGWSATAFPIGELVNNNNAYMTTDDMRTLQNLYGWEFGGHSYSEAMHSASGGNDGGGYADPSWSIERVERDIMQNIAWLQSVGIRWSGLFAWPRGGLTPALMQTVARYYSFGRSSAALPNPGVLPDRPFDLRSKGTDGQTQAAILAFIQRAIDNKTWLNIRIHDITAGTPVGVQTKQSDITAYLDAIKVAVDAGTAEVLTMSQALRRNITGA